MRVNIRGHLRGKHRIDFCLYSDVELYLLIKQRDATLSLVNQTPMARQRRLSIHAVMASWQANHSHSTATRYARFPLLGITSADVVPPLLPDSLARLLFLVHTARDPLQYDTRSNSVSLSRVQYSNIRVDVLQEAG